MLARRGKQDARGCRAGQDREGYGEAKAGQDQHDGGKVDGEHAGNGRSGAPATVGPKVPPATFMRHARTADNRGKWLPE